MLFAGWQVRIVRLTLTNPKPANNLFIFFLTLSNQVFNSFTPTRTNTPRFPHFPLEVNGEIFASSLKLRRWRHKVFSTHLQLGEVSFDFRRLVPSCICKLLSLLEAGML